MTPDLAPHLDWARRTGAAWARRLPDFEVEEGEAIALLALVETSRAWRPDGGASLRTLAFARIRGAILRAHSRQVGRTVRRVSVEGHDSAVPPRLEAHLMLKEVAALSLPQNLETLLIHRRLGGESLERVGMRLGLKKARMCQLDARLTAELAVRVQGKSAA